MSAPTMSLKTAPGKPGRYLRWLQLAPRRWKKKAARARYLEKHPEVARRERHRATLRRRKAEGRQP